MNDKIREMMEEDNLEEKIQKGMKQMEYGLYTEEDVDTIPETYKAIETKVKTKGYEVYYNDGEIVFATALNVENNFGHKIYTLDKLDEEEEAYLEKKCFNKKQNSSKVTGLVFLVIGIFFMVITGVNTLVYLIESISQKTDFDTVIAYMSAYFIMPVVLSSILTLLSVKTLKNRKK